jgi:hypothetical protein
MVEVQIVSPRATARRSQALDQAVTDAFKTTIKEIPQHGSKSCGEPRYN